MILRLRAQILEDRLFPVTLHMIPVVNHSMSNGIVDAVARSLGVGECLIADEEVKVLNTPFRC